MATSKPIGTGLILVVIGVVAWRVTGVFPTEQTLEPLWWSRQTWQAGEHYRLLTSIFAHGGLIHLAMNGIALASLAPLERDIGTPRYVAIFLAAGIGGNIAHALTTSMPAVGASGGLFGLLGLLVALAPGTRLSLFGLPVRAVILLPAYAAAVLFVPGIQDLAPIAHMAHLGGLAVGMAAGALLSPRQAFEHLAYALVAFAAVGVIVLNLHAVGFGTVPTFFVEGDLGGLLIRAWPALVGLAVLAWVAWSTGDEAQAV